MLLIYFLLWRSFDFLIIFFSQKIIPYLGFFPYKDQLPGFNLPNWLSSLANFDGLHYISIARDGYAQYEQAFFPLYPLSIKLITPLFFNNQLLTGLIISNISFLIGLYIFYIYLRLVQTPKLGVSTINFNKFQQISIIFLLLAFPTSFFFGAVYTEGLFFLLIVSALYFLKKNNYLLVIILAFLASLTRLVGVFLIIPILFHLIQRPHLCRGSGGQVKVKSLFILSPLLGLGLYCFYLFKTTGDPFFFLTSQPIFGANRSSHLIFLPQVYWRYLKIFFTANWDFRYFVSILEFSFFSFILIILILDMIKNLTSSKAGKNYDLIGLSLFSFANLILPTLTGTFSSIPRYVLFSLSFFIYLAQIKNVFIKYLVIGIFMILHVLLLGYFTQGYFIS